MLKRFGLGGSRSADTQRTGLCAEAQTEAFLRQQGLSSVTRNYRCKRGELDLIMQHHDALVFVEVRYRRESRFGSGSDTVDQRKQRKLILAAQHYLQQQRLTDKVPCRFDVVSVSGNLDNPHFDWVQNAFGA